MGTSKKSKYMLSSMVTPASDRVREELGSEWLIKQNGKFEMVTSSFNGSGKFIGAVWGDVTINQEFEAPPYYMMTQSITLISNSEKFPTYEQFRKYVLGAPLVLGVSAEIPPLIVTGSLFGDTTLSLPVPYSQEELKTVENSSRPLSYEVIPNYNFYQSFYESQTITVPEQILPNLYNIYKEGDTDDLSPDALNTFDEGLNGIAQLLGDISDTNIGPEEEVLPIENIDFVKNANPYKRIFPMYNEINFSTQITTNFAEILEDSKLSTDFLEFLSATSPGKVSFTGFIEELSIGQRDEVSFVAVNSAGDLEIFDVFTWWGSVLKRFGGTTIDSTVPGTSGTSVAPPTIIGPDPSELNKFSKFIHLLTFEGKMQKMVNKYLRSYTDLLKGVPSYSETVAYKVEKRKSGQLITTYLFPNSNEIEVYNFVDTQVKYGESYQYIAYAYQLTLGSEYLYNNLSLAWYDGDRIHFDDVDKEDENDADITETLTLVE